MGRIGYALKEILSNGTDRGWWKRRFQTRVMEPYFEARSGSAQTIMDYDWDLCIILDACRADLYQDVVQQANLGGAVDTRTSVASATEEFLKETFDDDEYHDTVYIASNPLFSRHLNDGQFHSVKHVWRDGWDHENGTVTPDTMCQSVREAADSYPNKRLIAHFLQPHVPFLGTDEFDSPESIAARETQLGNGVSTEVKAHETPFDLLERGEVPKDEVWRAYEENLRIALSPIEDLVSDLDRRIAITSDHGNAFGERAWPFPIRVYGHPHRILIPELTTVPWHVIESETRPEIYSEDHEPDTSDSSSVEDVDDRLAALGYLS